MKFPKPPRGAKAIPWRMPIWIYRLGMGWMLGNRALLLSHKGRISGKTRQTVLEIIHHSPGDQTYYVVSGFGTQSHWYQNIHQEPRVKIQVGSNQIEAIATQLDPDETELVFFSYAQKHPQALRGLANLLGYEISHTPEGYRSFGREIPVIQFSANDNRL
ncbi:MAG: nitroreductase family deazaflavin-dependent oxidoreductase [Anaerolineales bacterium]